VQDPLDEHAQVRADVLAQGLVDHHIRTHSLCWFTSDRPQSVVAMVSVPLAASFMANNMGPSHRLAPSWLVTKRHAGVLPPDFS
jgi:hypothetical protein